MRFDNNETQQSYAERPIYNREGYDYMISKQYNPYMALNISNTFNTEVIKRADEQCMITPSMSPNQIREVLTMCNNPKFTNEDISLIYMYSGHIIRIYRYLMEFGFDPKVVGYWANIYPNDFRKVMLYVLMEVKPGETIEDDVTIINYMYRTYQYALAKKKKFSRVWLDKVQADYRNHRPGNKA